MVHYESDYAITHALAYTDGALLPDATIVVEQGIIKYVGKHDQKRVQHLDQHDAKGNLVGPGLVDMHIHGCGGFDSTRGNVQENLECMALFLAGKGITSFQLAVVMDLDLLGQIKKKQWRRVLSFHPICLGSMWKALLSHLRKGAAFSLQVSGPLTRSIWRGFFLSSMERGHLSPP